MKATFVSKEKNVVKFTMEFTAEEFENAIVKAYQANKGKFEIDGFRKGKAPRSIIEKHYGEGVFFEDAINEMFSEGYPNAIQELQLDVINTPGADFSEIAKGKDITVTVDVEVYPDVEVENYKGVEVEKIEATVTDDDVDAEIKNIQRRNARMNLVERPIQDGDTVLIDYAGFVGDEQFEGGTAERYPLKIGSGTFIPGFEDQLIGASAGDDVDVKVTFPEEYHADDLAGKEAIFKCKVHEVKEQELPEIDDEFVKDVSECDTLDELKAQTKENLEKANAAKAENDMKEKAMEAVCAANTIDIPEIMVQEEMEESLKRFDQQLQQQGLNLQQYFEFSQEDPEEFKAQFMPECKKRVKMRMIIKAIADKENFEVSNEEIDKEIENMAQMYSMDVETVKGMLGAENIGYIAGDLKMRKAIDFVFDNAVIK